MRILETKIKGLFKPYKEEASIDFGSLGPGLVAIVGPNGEGKTAILESIVGVLYGSFPSRTEGKQRSIYDYVVSNKAWMQSTFDFDGRIITARADINGQNKTSEWALTERGLPQLNARGKYKEYLSMVKSLFGSKQLCLASSFVAQNKSGVITEMGQKDRKSLFAELLNIGYLETLSVRAGEKRKLASAKMEALALSRSSLETDIARSEINDSEITALDLEISRLTEEVGRLSKEQEILQEQLAEATAQADNYNALNKDLLSNQALLRSANRELEQVNEQWNTKINNHNAEISRLADSIKIDIEATIRSSHATEVATLKLRQDNIKALLLRQEEVAEAQAELLQVVAAKENIIQAEEIFNVATTKLYAARLKFKEKTNSLEAHHQRLVFQLQTLTGQTTLLDQVPCTDAPTWSHAELSNVALSELCPLLTNATEAQQKANQIALELKELLSESCPKRIEIEAIKVDLAVIEKKHIEESKLSESRKRVLKGLKEKETGLRIVVGLKSAIDRAKIQQQETITETRFLQERIEKEIQTALLEAEETKKRIESLQTEVELLEVSHTKAKGVVVGTINSFEKTIANIVEQLKTNVFNEQQVIKIKDHLERLKSEVPSAQAALREYELKKAGLQSRIELVKAKKEELDIIKADELKWRLIFNARTILETSLGRDGIQAFEVSAAGPEVSIIVNDLLDACYGSEFSMEIDTLVANKDGTVKEAFAIFVYHNGEKRLIEDLSPGQVAIVLEALSLGISIYNGQKLESHWETLIRDETAGALWPETAQKYILMLRRALVIGRYFQIIFVSHQPQIWEAADSKIWVSDGSARVVSEIPIGGL